MEKKTLVAGASDNPSRYSYLAVQFLLNKGYEPIPFGNKKGEVLGIPIRNNLEGLSDVHTITLYMRAEVQEKYYDEFLKLKPKRIIFNPGTENDTFRDMAEAQGIETLYACTLVMLNTRQF